MYHLIFFYIIPILALLKFFNYLRVSNLTMETRYHMQHLHARLILLGIKDNKYQSDIGFQFMEKSMTRTAQWLPKMNFWVILYLAFKDRKKNNFALFPFEKTIVHNSEVKAIYNEFTKTTVNFFKSKSKLSLTFFVVVIAIIIWLTALLQISKGVQFVRSFKAKLKYFLIMDSELVSEFKPAHC